MTTRCFGLEDFVLAGTFVFLGHPNVNLRIIGRKQAGLRLTIHPGFKRHLPKQGYRWLRYCGPNYQ